MPYYLSEEYLYPMIFVKCLLNIDLSAAHIGSTSC